MTAHQDKNGDLGGYLTQQGYIVIYENYANY